MPVSLIYLLLFIACATAGRIPYLSNVTFVAISNVSSVTLTNLTCDQCLCQSISSHLILNCFPDSSCQLFTSIPRTYRIKPTLNALLYFPQGIIPNDSQCCMPNASLLLDTLNTTTPMYANVNTPRCILLDDQGYLVTVSYNDKTIVRFHPDNLTRISQPASPVFNDSPFGLSYFNGAYYVAFDYSISVVHSGNMTQLHTISTSELSGAQDMIFLHYGQMMIVSSNKNNRLVFFNRSSAGSYNYDFIGYQRVNYSAPHGLLYVNDTFFYATSWDNGTVYAYSSSGNATSWTEKLALDVGSSVGHINTRHVFIDPCGRYWLSSKSDGVKITGSDGSLLSTFAPMGSSPFNTLITDNYLIYLPDSESNRIIRIDPNIQC